MVRRAEPADCAAAAVLHANELPGEFLSSLGVRFLTVLYRGINAHPDGFVLVAERDGGVVGFVSGATNSAAVSKAVMRRHRLTLAFWAGGRVLVHPRLLCHVFAAMSHRDDDYAGKAELLSIAVSSRVQGAGVGQALLAAFKDEMRRRGVAFFHLIVDERNARAQTFYKRNGLESLERITMFGTWKNRMGCHLR